MRLDLSPMVQEDKGFKRYLITNFQRVQRLFVEAASKAELDAHVHTPQSVSVFRNTNLSVPHNTTTLVNPFSGARYDSGGMWDGSGLIVAPIAGQYLVWASIQWDNNATGIRSLLFKVNNSTIIVQTHVPSNGVSGPGMSASRIYKLNANDNIRLEVFQDSGGALNLLGAANYSMEFGMTWLGP